MHTPASFLCLTLNVVLTSAVVWMSTLTGCSRQRNFTSESSALESLECRTDYRTHIRCSWRKNPSNALSLFHMDPEDYRVAPCVRIPNPSQNSPGQERVFCRYNTSLFAIGFDDVFFFHTPHSPAISRTFHLTKYNDAKWTFNQLDNIPSSHSNPDYLMSLLTSDPFRHHDQERQECDINHKTGKEKPGVKIYIEPTLKDMEDEVNQSTTEGSKTMSYYNLPGPSNLHCEHLGEKNLSCSWELTTDLAQYISYTLSYRTCFTALAEWCCVEKVEVRNMGHLLRMVGVFSLFESGVLQVKLTPTPVTRVIQAYKHIQPACPTGLRVELRGQDWILNWTLPEYRTVPLTTELQYWSILAPEDVKIISLSDPVTVFSIPEHSLMGSSEYRARVRCGVRMRRRLGQRYSGYPSDWTDPVSWITQPEPLGRRLLAFFLYFLIATLSAAVSIVAFFILVALQRKLRDWNESLPSPAKSKVSEVTQCPQRDLLPSWRELQDIDISSAQIVDVSPQFSSFDSECTTNTEGSNHWRPTEQNTIILHVDDPCQVTTQRTFGNVMGINILWQDNTIQPRIFIPYDKVFPCLEGYMQNPATSTGITQNALREACHLNAEINDGYMNCLEPVLVSSQRKKNTCLLHRHDLNTEVFLPSIRCLQADSEKN